MKNNLSSKRASLELVFAGALWGYGFIATIYALSVYNAVEVTVYRFLIAALLGEILRRSFQKDWDFSNLNDLKLAFPAGLLLGAMLLAQTEGLKTTTAAKSGFITSLYVIIVPFASSLFLKIQVTIKDYLAAALALLGAYMLVGGKIEHMSIGDFWTALCAILAAFHILYLGKISHQVQNSFRFNNYQSLACFILALPFLFFQQADIKLLNFSETSSFLGLLYLATFSSIIAFTIQVRAQKVIAPTAASMIFLLESPFAMFFGILLLNETHSPLQYLGAFTMLVACALSVYWHKETPQ